MVIVMLFAAFPAATQDEPIEVRVLIAFTDYRLDWAREQAAEFNALFPEYNVIVDGLADYESLFNSTILAFEQGTPPAVIQYFEAASQEALDAVAPSGEPLLKSVTEAIDGRTEINGVPVILGDVVDSAQTYYTFDGEFASAPWNTSSAIMFTNTSFLEAAGIEEIPATWSELEAACEVIMALDNAPEACVTWPNHSWWVEQTMAQMGELLANNENGRAERATEVFINSEGMIDYINWWKNLDAQGYYLYTGAQRDWTGTYNAFIAGQVAFLQYSSSDTTILTNDGADAGFEVVASFLPYDDSKEFFGNIIGGATLWLTNGLAPEVEEGALMFINYFNNVENAAEWHQITGYIPITQTAVELLEEEGWFEANPNSLVASEQLEISAELGGSPGVLVGNFVAIRDVITAAIEDILVNDLDVASRLEEANAEANRLLEEYNFLYVD